MVKNKFLSMSCEERKKAKYRYFGTDEGMALKSRLNRLLIYGILLVCFGIYVIIDAIIQSDTHLQLFYGIGLIIVAAVFIIGRYFVIVKKVDDFLTEEESKVTVKAKIIESKKEVPAKKAPEAKKEAPVKKAEVKKEVKKAPAKKAPAKKAPAKKTTATKTTKTTKKTK